MDYLIDYIGLSLLFFVASLAERNLFLPKDEPRPELTFKELGKRYLVFAACAVWLYLLFKVYN
jgi:hypothetical protein